MDENKEYQMTLSSFDLSIILNALSREKDYTEYLLKEDKTKGEDKWMLMMSKSLLEDLHRISVKLSHIIKE